MNVLSQSREELIQHLNGAGFSCTAFLPERITPPTVVVTPSSPYIEMGATLCDSLINLRVLVIAKTASNKKESEAVDELLIGCILELINQGWAITDVSAFELLTANNATYLSGSISISKYITLGG